MSVFSHYHRQHRHTDMLQLEGSIYSSLSSAKLLIVGSSQHPIRVSLHPYLVLEPYVQYP